MLSGPHMIINNSHVSKNFNRISDYVKARNPKEGVSSDLKGMNSCVQRFYFNNYSDFFNLNKENAEYNVERSFCQLRTRAAMEPWLLMALILNILRTVRYC